jgi:hypothetical protein
MKIFLVRGNVERSRYMHDKSEKFEDFRLVYALSEYEAEDKWKWYWEDKSSPYDVHYSANCFGAAEAIE